MNKLLCLFLLLCASYFATAQPATKKIMLEEFTGAWCGWCPEGTIIADSLKALFGDKLIVVANHVNDDLQVPDGRQLRDELNTYAYPSATIDRYHQPGEPYHWFLRDKWQSYAQDRLNNAAIASVSFSDCLVSTDSKYEMDVTVAFNAVPAAGIPLKLNVYVLEDSITAVGSLSQANSSPAVQSGAYVLRSWYHNNTLRTALGGAWGLNPFPSAPATGTLYKQHFTFTKPADWNAAQIRLIAYLAYDGATSANQREVLNCDEKTLKSFLKATSVTPMLPLCIQSIAPNPAPANSAVKLVFSTVCATTVSLFVYNSIGQIIAETPKDIYTSGIHTLEFRSSDYYLAPGVYFLKLLGPAASNIQRLEIK